MDSPRATVVVVFLLAALAAQSCSDNPAKGRPRPGEEPEISRASSTGFADLVRALLRHAGAAYSENNHEEAREFLRQARRRGSSGEIYDLPLEPEFERPHPFDLVAVGTPVTRGPPHRSRRALLARISHR